LASTTKPRKRTTSRSTGKANAGAAKKPSRTPRAPRTRATSQARSTARGVSEKVSSVGDTVGETAGSVGSTVNAVAETARHEASTIAKGAVAATLGTAVAAAAGRALIASRRQRHVLGVRIPRSHKGLKGIAKQLSGIAGEFEKKSLDVSKASGRAKEAAKILA
jgi:hypothetical protein